MVLVLFSNDQLFFLQMKKTKWMLFQELFEKIDQEDDGEVYLRFDKFFNCNLKICHPNYISVAIPVLILKVFV